MISRQINRMIHDDTDSIKGRSFTMGCHRESELPLPLNGVPAGTTEQVNIDSDIELIELSEVSPVYAFIKKQKAVYLNKKNIGHVQAGIIKKDRSKVIHQENAIPKIIVSTTSTSVADEEAKKIQDEQDDTNTLQADGILQLRRKSSPAVLHTYHEALSSLDEVSLKSSESPEYHSDSLVETKAAVSRLKKKELLHESCPSSPNILMNRIAQAVKNLAFPYMASPKLARQSKASTGSLLFNATTDPSKKHNAMVLQSKIFATRTKLSPELEKQLEIINETNRKQILGLIDRVKAIEHDILGCMEPLCDHRDCNQRQLNLATRKLEKAFIMVDRYVEAMYHFICMGYTGVFLSCQKNLFSAEKDANLWRAEHQALHRFLAKHRDLLLEASYEGAKVAYKSLLEHLGFLRRQQKHITRYYTKYKKQLIRKPSDSDDTTDNRDRNGLDRLSSRHPWAHSPTGSGIGSSYTHRETMALPEAVYVMQYTPAMPAPYTAVLMEGNSPLGTFASGKERKKHSF